MKKVAITMMMCITALCTAMAQSPMTPRAAMANCGMVDPGAHIENDYNTPEAFIERNKMLDAQVTAWAAEQTKNINMNFDPAKAQRQNEQRQKEMMRRTQSIDPQKQMEAVQLMMADIKAYYNLSDQELGKLMNMSDKQGNAYITKRAKELGVEVKFFDPTKYGIEGVYEDENMALADKRQQVQKRIDELEKVIQTYQNRVDVVLNDIASLEKTAEAKCKVEMDKWEAEYEAIPTAAGLGGTKDLEKVNELYRKATRALILFEQQVWIAPACEKLKGLLAYAEAADAANDECLKLTLSVAGDDMTRQALVQKYNHKGYSAYVWGLYRKVTEEYCRFVERKGFH